MHVRYGVLLAASIALAAWPASTAFATGDPPSGSDYPPSEYCTITASLTALHVGESTKVVVKTKPSTPTELTITSKSASSTQAKTADADGIATFTLSPEKSGKYSLNAKTGDSKACALSLVVKPTATKTATESEQEEAAAELAFTGATTAPYLVAAGTLAAGGVVLVAVARRRRAADVR